MKCIFMEGIDARDQTSDCNVLSMEDVNEMIASAESKKDINAVQRCSVENQKGAIAVQRLAIAAF